MRAYLIVALVVAGLAGWLKPVAQAWERLVRVVRLVVFAGVAATLGGSGVALALHMPRSAPYSAAAMNRPPVPLRLAADARSARAVEEPDATVSVTVPIVMYHEPPANFEDQLVYLEQHGYTAIDLDALLAGMQGRSLPAKPVVLTFDDGYASQMAAFESLKRHGMKATFYIIDGGEASWWCIGAGRRYGDALQPLGGCGDAYLNWDQVRILDRSGLVTIGAHTVNHRDLAALSVEEQRYEIIEGKRLLEAQLGHGVRHFAYPYGSYTADSVAAVKEAGLATAVTTTEGTFQGGGSNLELRRMRDAMMLP